MFGVSLFGRHLALFSFFYYRKDQETTIPEIFIREFKINKIVLYSDNWTMFLTSKIKYFVFILPLLCKYVLEIAIWSEHSLPYQGENLVQYLHNFMNQTKL